MSPKTPRPPRHTFGENLPSGSKKEETKRNIWEGEGRKKEEEEKPIEPTEEEKLIIDKYEKLVNDDNSDPEEVI